MSDNVAITAGTGTTVAADEVVDGTLGTVKVQYVKLMDGTLDGTTKAAVGATGLKVDASGAAVPVTDNAGSLTIDAPVATPVFVRLSDGAAAIATLPVSLATNTPDVTDRAARLLGVVASITNALPVGANVIGAVTQSPATLVVTAVSAANTTVTATLPAVASQFHYISRIVIERVATTAIVGSALLTYTSTNLPGSWARTSGNAAPIGQQMKDVDEVLTVELKSSVVNTATTIIAPAAGAAGVIRITVYYRTAA